MEYYAGIDVSLEWSSICVVDALGKIVKEAKISSEPAPQQPCPHPDGATRSWRSGRRGQDLRHLGRPTPGASASAANEIFVP